MQCPLCTIELDMTSRLGLEIDYCPKCRGLWLDLSELDKLLERSIEASPSRAPTDWVDNVKIHGHPHARRYKH